MNMPIGITVRRFEREDAGAVSRLILDNLMLVNIHDYGEAAVQNLARFYTPQLLLEYAQQGESYVAVQGSNILGTATLEQNRVRNVFVRMTYHQQGVGRILMRHIEKTARQQGKACLVLQANTGAVGFYQKLGYVQVETIAEQIGDALIRIAIMQKML
jgi:GNAT superfamily N-acetyltransferase